VRFVGYHANSKGETMATRKKPTTPPSPPKRPGQPGPDEAKVTVIIAKDLAKRIKFRAVEQETSVKAILVRALEDYLNR
jgi:hypothetical protein